jgi:hypothetical protein
MPCFYNLRHIKRYHSLCNVFIYVHVCICLMYAYMCMYAYVHVCGYFLTKWIWTLTSGTLSFLVSPIRKNPPWLWVCMNVYMHVCMYLYVCVECISTTCAHVYLRICMKDLIQIVYPEANPGSQYVRVCVCVCACVSTRMHVTYEFVEFLWIAFVYLYLWSMSVITKTPDYVYICMHTCVGACMHVYM